MKEILFLLLCVASAAVSAQAPQGIPYQAIARNASGAAIANTAVKVRFSIRDSIATGAIRYQETHNPTTSVLGLFSVNVGMGTVVSGTFSGINWGKNAKFLQVELNTTGGTTYTDLGTTQMMSVPYALHSGGVKLRASVTGDTLFSGGGNFLIVPGISAANPPPNTVTDIDGNVYQKVTIGNQVWMKENLKVSSYRNGDAISTNLSDAEWETTSSGAFAIHSNQSANNTIYGKLYNWYAVSDPRGLCPVGWHVPTHHDWQLLTKFLDPATDTTQFEPNIAGGNMKTTGTIEGGDGLWYSPNTDATNSSGFSGLPGGFRDASGNYIIVGYYGAWWSSTEYSSTLGWWSILDYSIANFGRSNNDTLFSKSWGFSVRCIRD